VDIPAINNSGTPILQGQVVRRTGFVQPQQVSSIALASAASTSTFVALGIAINNIAIGNTGQVRIDNNFSPIDTTGFSLNSIVYLSDTPGAISSSSGTNTFSIGYATVIGVSGNIFVQSNTSNTHCSSGQSSTIVGAQGVTGLQGLTGISGGGTGLQGSTGLGAGIGASNTLNMGLQGDLSLISSLPFTNVGSELCGGPVTYVDFRARREIPGISGTTTIQLELNGSAVLGAILSWTSLDGVFALKSTTISVSSTGGSRLSFRVTSIEGGNPQNIFAEVNA
jgi:hypothetical protein